MFSGSKGQISLAKDQEGPAVFENSKSKNQTQNIWVSQVPWQLQ